MTAVTLLWFVQSNESGRDPDSELLTYLNNIYSVWSVLKAQKITIFVKIAGNEQAMNIDTNGREKEIHRCVTCVQEKFYCLSKKHRYGQLVNYVIIRNERTNYKLL